MTKGISGRIGLAVVAVMATMWLAAGLEANPVEPVGDPECRLVIDAEIVTIGSEPVTLRAETTEDIGEPTAAMVEEESGAEVVSVAADEAENGVRITLDTSEAQPGAWELTLRANGGECRGDVLIVDDGN